MYTIINSTNVNGTFYIATKIFALKQLVTLN